MLIESTPATSSDTITGRTSPTQALTTRSPPLPTLFTLAVITALYLGWTIRNEYLITAESGLGYALGIIGGSMMLLLLIYPLRKRFHHSAIFIFSTKNWFKLHMILGVLGPLLILYHSNFSLGSTNSNVALASMLLMVTSGLIGRYIYGKIHYGLYGKKVQLQELMKHQLLARKQLDDDQADEAIFISETLNDRLHSFERSLVGRKGLLGNLFRVVSLGLTTRISYWMLVRRLRKDQQHNKCYMRLSRAERRQHFNPVRLHIDSYLSTVRKISGLIFYERLFSLWHMLHLPIFFMLIITGFVHVYAVHAY
ncbi:MAG: hypothetical protein ACERLB_10145 [Gammaproteobacteria bacterium]